MATVAAIIVPSSTELLQAPYSKTVSKLILLGAANGLPPLWVASPPPK
jgi:hypothetical protein